MEDYYRHRLRSFSQGRVQKPRLLLENHIRRAAYVKSTDIVAVDDETFSVPSEQNIDSDDDSQVTYLVNWKLGTCTCQVAKTGRFCKHQAAIWIHTGTVLPSLPPLTGKHRHQMAVLALGEQAEPASFYDDFVSTTPSVTSVLDVGMSASGLSHTNNPVTPATVSLHTAGASEHTEQADGTSAGESTFRLAIKTMCELHERFGSSPAAAAKLLKRLKHITTPTQWETFLHTTGAAVSCVYRSGAKIRVQPTAISRRRPSVTRGSKRIAAGRPPLSAAESFRRKRLRNLSNNVAANQPNAKAHGRAH